MAIEDRPPLRLAVAQFDAVSGDLDDNISCHVQLLEQAAAGQAALAVFPEMSITGYCSGRTDPAEQAVDPQGDALRPLRACCERLDISAVVGAPVGGEAGLHISSIVIGHGGDIETVYHKMYLDADERRWFTRGGEPQQIEVDGWRLGLGICYDSSFPEHARGYALSGADAYLVSGAFPLGRSDYRRTIYFPARSLENTMYLAFSNYVGSHDGLDYGGMSAIHGPDGQCLNDAGATEPGIALCDVDDALLRETRARLQMLQDRN